MRRFGRLFLTVGAVALMAAPAWAQQRGGFGGGFGGGGFILMAPNVQKDLKLTDEQVGKVQETLESVRDKHQDEFAALRDLPQEERFKKARALSKTTTDEVKQALAFTPEQSKRFDQINLQQRGYQAFADPEMQDKLKLSDEQKSKIREIGASTRERSEEIRKSFQEDREGAMKKMNELRKENLDKALAVLTDHQKKTWKDLTGEPIEVRFERRPNN